jgi:hypothetical protein
MTTRHVLVLSLKRDALTENKKLSSRVYNINVLYTRLVLSFANDACICMSEMCRFTSQN